MLLQLVSWCTGNADSERLAEGEAKSKCIFPQLLYVQIRCDDVKAFGMSLLVRTSRRGEEKFRRGG